MSKKNYELYSNNIIKISEIDLYNEVELFLEISSLEYYLLIYNRIKAYNGGMGIDTTGDQKKLENLIKKTQKFGVQLDFDAQGKVIKSADYLEWYEYYITHFKTKLNKEEFEKFMMVKTKEYSCSKYLPELSYLEYKNKNRYSQKISEKMPIKKCL